MQTKKVKTNGEPMLMMKIVDKLFWQRHVVGWERADTINTVS